MDAAAREPDVDRLWRELRALVAHMVSAADRRTFLNDALDLLIDLAGADRGLILLLSDGAALPIQGRAPGRSLTPSESAEVSRTLVREAVSAGRAILWEPSVSAAAPSAVQIGIAAALVAPIAGRSGARGVVYLDFRGAGRRLGARHCDFLDTAAQLVSMVLASEERSDPTRARSRADAGAPPSLEELCRPPSMDAVRGDVSACLSCDLPVLITGESGTGKTLLAHALAEADARRPIVRATLGQSDDLNTITSELFGHERGAFSGATARRIGLVEFADGGTLILDEVLNLPAHAQQLLLDFTQFGTYRPLGWSAPEPKRARVRLISATNGDLAAAIAAGRFREDLYYRIAAIPLALPPLRARRAEIPALAEGLLGRFDAGREWSLDIDARRLLSSDELDWPGNARQLEAVVQRARLRAVTEDPAARRIERRHVDVRGLSASASATSAGPSPPATPATPAPASAAPPEPDDAPPDRDAILAALDRCAGNQTRAAELLGISRRTLVRRLAELDLPRPRKR